MTTAGPQHAQPNRLRDAWRVFRRWRSARPFWGGLLTALAGLEILGTTQTSLGALSFQMGPSGFLSWVVPTVLATCGLLMWFSPQHRIFYAVVATVTALFSLIAVNLGGFFLGLLLGTVGSALACAWVPGAHRIAQSGSQSPGDDQTVRDDPGGDQMVRDEAGDDQMLRDEAGDNHTVRGDPKAGGSRDLPADTAPEAPIASSRRSSTS